MTIRPPRESNHYDVARICAKVKQRREELGLSLEDLSEMTAIPYADLASFENGAVNGHYLNRVYKALSLE